MKIKTVTMAGHHKARPWFQFFICHRSTKSNERRWIIWRALRKKYAPRLLAPLEWKNGGSKQQNVAISQIVNNRLRKRCPRDLHVKDLVVSLCYSWIDNFAHISHRGYSRKATNLWLFCIWWQRLDSLKLNRINARGQNHEKHLTAFIVTADRLLASCAKTKR